MEELLQQYIDDAREMLVALESQLLKLETNKTDKEAIEAVFRVMHNLKGSAGMYGFENIGKITHVLESVYDNIRDDTTILNKEILDITFQSVDYIKNLLENSDVLEESEVNEFSTLINTIEDLLNVSSSDKPQNNKTDNSAGSSNVFYIIFKPTDETLQRGVNIYTLFNEIVELGKHSIKQNGSSLSIKEQFENRKVKSSWEIILALKKKTKEDIEDTLIFLQDDEYSIAELQNSSVPEDLLKNLIAPLEIELQGTLEFINEFTKKIRKQKKTLSSNVKQTIKNAIKKEESIRVSSSKLDVLINLVSELVTSKAHLDLLAEEINDTRLTKALESIDKLSKRFRDNALELRLIPIESIMTNFKRLVRDLSGSLKKPIDFVTEGTDTELDKTIISGLEKPIMHLIRNAADHGIESPEERLRNNKTKVGLIKFIAFYSGANVFIQIQDDGAGIDKDKILKKAISKGIVSSKENLTDKEIYNLIFTPGFSTAENVSDVSGRGVGMDVVKTSIEEMRGEIEINTEIGLGTSFTIKLPLTLSIIDTLQVKVKSTDFLIPLSDVELCENIATSALTKKSHQTIELNKELVPFIFLRKEFNQLEGLPEEQKLVIIKKEDKRVAIAVDSVIGEHQAVLKPLGDIFSGQEYLSGGSIMGDGTVSLVLDTNKLALKSQKQVQ